MLVLAVVFLGIAVVVGVVYGTDSLGTVIFMLDPPLLNTLQAGIQRNIAPWVWDSALLPVLEQPAWLVPLVIGGVLLAAGAMQRRAR